MPSTISSSSRMCVLPLVLSGIAEHLMHRQHGVVSRVIGVVARRPVDDHVALAHGEVVGDRDRLVVRDEEAVLRARRRAPGTHARVCAGPEQVHRGAAALVMRAGVLRHPLLVRAPAELGRLQALRHEAFDRPGVDEHAHGLRVLGALRVALGDVDALHAHALHELRPFIARLRLLVLEADVPGDVEERLLDEPGHHAGIGAAAVHRRGAAGRPAAGIENVLAQQ